MENILLCSSADNRLTYRLKRNYDESQHTVELDFYLVDASQLKFMVHQILLKDNNLLPSLFEKDMIVTLVSGKYPLADIDCGQQTFVFQKANGSQFAMLVTGFTWMCALPIKEQQIELDNSKTYYIRLIGELISINGVAAQIPRH